jgi:hypothetical protein
MPDKSLAWDEVDTFHPWIYDFLGKFGKFIREKGIESKSISSDYDIATSYLHRTQEVPNSIDAALSFIHTYIDEQPREHDTEISRDIMDEILARFIEDFGQKNA